MPATKAKEVTRRFDVDRETKRTIRFSEQPADGEPVAMDTVYVQKHILHALGNPEHIEVVIRAVS